MKGVVGRAPGGQQTHDAVDDDFGINLVAHARVGRLAEFHRTLDRSRGEGFTQRCAWVDKRCAWQVQAHDFHQHLVGVGSAVEGAGASAVVSRLLGGEQGVTVDQTLGVLLPHLGLVVVGQPRRHGPRRHKHGGQMAKLQSAHEQAWHDFVAHTQKQSGVKHVVRQAHGRGQGNHIAREQRQLHAVFALGHTIAHGGYATSHLRGSARCPCGRANFFRVMLIGLVGREHVVVGRDHPHVGLTFLAQHQFVVGGHGGVGMGGIGAAHAAAVRAWLFGLCQHL